MKSNRNDSNGLNGLNGPGKPGDKHLEQGVIPSTAEKKFERIIDCHNTKGNISGLQITKLVNEILKETKNDRKEENE